MSSILVVDDERTIADTLALILRQSGYCAEAVYSGEEAILYLDQQSPDLVISDVVMPGMTGIDLAIRIAENYSSSEVLLISGNATTNDLMKQARATGHMFTLLTKPIHPVDLLRHVASLLPHSPSQNADSTAA